jgi:hypothetical protein
MPERRTHKGELRTGTRSCTAGRSTTASITIAGILWLFGHRADIRRRPWGGDMPNFIQYPAMVSSGEQRLFDAAGRPA